MHAPKVVYSGAIATALMALPACAYDGPAGLVPNYEPIVVDSFDEARSHNGGHVFEFVTGTDKYLATPDQLPAGEVMLTLTYVGDEPAPHSLVFEGINNDQPIVAVDLPGSNNGTIVLTPGEWVFFDGAPGNRQMGLEGRLTVVGTGEPGSVTTPHQTVEWETTALEFTSAPRSAVADQPIALELTVSDALPHSIAFEAVRGEQPLVAVDGPGTNQRTITMPPGTYVYFCAVPGHREAGMEGLITLR